MFEPEQSHKKVGSEIYFHNFMASKIHCQFGHNLHGIYHCLPLPYYPSLISLPYPRHHYYYVANRSRGYCADHCRRENDRAELNITHMFWKAALDTKDHTNYSQWKDIVFKVFHSNMGTVPASIILPLLSTVQALNLNPLYFILRSQSPFSSVAERPFPAAAPARCRYMGPAGTTSCRTRHR